MCFVLKKSDPNFREDLKPFIAEEDIIVYKFMFIVKKTFLWIPYKYMVRSFIYNLQKQYDLNKVYTALDMGDKPMKELTINLVTNSNGTYFIDHGFHSYTSMERIMEDYGKLTIKAFRENATVIKCIIPKGTAYYKNNRSEAVSTKIIFKQIIPYEVAYNVFFNVNK